MTVRGGRGTDGEEPDAQQSKAPVSIDTQGRLTLIDANFPDSAQAGMVARLQRVAEENAIIARLIEWTEVGFIAGAESGSRVDLDLGAL